MKSKIKTLSLFAAALGLVAVSIAVSPKEGETKPIPEPIVQPDKPIKKDPGKVQIALLLDTSNSMDGLIDQARSQLWKIVNQLADAKRDGRRPDIEIALLEYGNDSLPSAEGHLRVVLPFTTDLDKLSEDLFRLTTNGGQEYAGQAITVAMNTLNWSTDESALKLLFIAGNEGFNQGSVDPTGAVKAAAAQGITVNTIYCGNARTAEAAGWKDGAMLADGRFMTIDQDTKVVHIVAPQDALIAQLNITLNGTYIPYGAKGEEGFNRQSEQDMNATSAKQGAFVNRSLWKSQANYFNPTWDLVDGVKNGNIKVDKMKDKDLPAGMRGLDNDGRLAFVKAKGKERSKIQAQIRKLNEERAAFVAAERKKAGDAADSTLDLAMIDMVKDQASKKGYLFE